MNIAQVCGCLDVFHVVFTPLFSLYCCCLPSVDSGSSPFKTMAMGSNFKSIRWYYVKSSEGKIAIEAEIGDGLEPRATGLRL